MGEKEGHVIFDLAITAGLVWMCRISINRWCLSRCCFVLVYYVPAGGRQQDIFQLLVMCRRRSQHLAIAAARSAFLSVNDKDSYLACFAMGPGRSKKFLYWTVKFWR
jgi:hypothetical protein